MTQITKCDYCGEEHDVIHRPCCERRMRLISHLGKVGADRRTIQVGSRVRKQYRVVYRGEWQDELPPK